jgi:hypothetical protein
VSESLRPEPLTCLKISDIWQKGKINFTLKIQIWHNALTEKCVDTVGHEFFSHFFKVFL